MHGSKQADMVRLALNVWWMALLWGLMSCRTVRSTENCLYSRLNFYPCQPNAFTTTPGANEYAEYRTRIRYAHSDCIYRNRNYYPGWEIIRPIDTLGNPNIRLLYSPGFTYNETYKNEALVSYNVECPAGRLPFLAFSYLDLQPRECHGLCSDYVTVSCAGCGVSESCGVEPTDDLYSLEEESFTVTLRTSESVSYNGFELIVVCFDPLDAADDADTSVRRRKRHFNRVLKNWRKRAAQAPVNADIGDVDVHTTLTAPIPAPQPVRYRTLNIMFRDIVLYRDNVIVVIREGNVKARIGAVEKLMIHATNGDDYTFIREAATQNEFGERKLRRMRGPGEIVVFANEAKFFRYSKPPVTLTPIEQDVLMALTTELFDLIPRENSSYYEEEPDDLDYELYTMQSDAAGIPPPKHHDGPRSPPKPRRPVGTSAIQLSILTEESSNPVIRTIATSTLSIAKEQDPKRVDEEREYIKGKKKTNPTESTSRPTAELDFQLIDSTRPELTKPTRSESTRPELTESTRPELTESTRPELSESTRPELIERIIPAERG